MLKNISQLKCIVNEKEMFFHCDYDTSIAVAKEALFQFLKYLGQIEDAANAQEKSKIEEIKPDVEEQA